MKSYVGTKLIRAEACSAVDFEGREGRGIPGRLAGDRDEAGYRIVYPDGYVSWSPRATFEGAYRLITDEERELLGLGREPVDG